MQVIEVAAAMSPFGPSQRINSRARERTSSRIYEYTA
jgi:hypothetical protein